MLLPISYIPKLSDVKQNIPTQPLDKPNVKPSTDLPSSSHISLEKSEDICTLSESSDSESSDSDQVYVIPQRRITPGTEQCRHPSSSQECDFLKICF
jgi:hypothetical protein